VALLLLLLLRTVVRALWSSVKCAALWCEVLLCDAAWLLE
jgi:hypothetical protein